MTTLAERDRESIEEFSHMKTDRIAALEAERDAALGAVRQQADALHELAKERDEQRNAADMIAEERDAYAITCDALRAHQREVEAEREAAHRCIKTLDEMVANLGAERDDLRDDIVQYIERDTERIEEMDALRSWLDNNMTHYNTSEAGARPILAELGKRVWYHVTDDTESFPFSAAIDAAKEKP